MQLNLYIFNQLFRTCMALITVLISIIWLFQSIRLLEFVVDKGASVGEFFAMSVASMPLWLMITVPISGFIAVNWVFSRILADRELTVMQAVGLAVSTCQSPDCIGFGVICIFDHQFGLYFAKLLSNLQRPAIQTPAQHPHRFVARRCVYRNCRWVNYVYWQAR